MSQFNQLLIVFTVLALLPVAIKLLWKIRLFPLALTLLCTQLFFPKWASAHEMLCMALLLGSCLFAILCWTVKFIRWRQSTHFHEDLMMERYAREIGLAPGQYKIRRKHGVARLEYDH